LQQPTGSVGADPVTRSGRSYAVTGASINRATAVAAAVPAEHKTAALGLDPKSDTRTIETVLGRLWQVDAKRRPIDEPGAKPALKNRFYGYRRIRAELRREGFLVNHKRIQRLMRQDNLLCLRKRPFVPVTTDSQHGWPVVPNLARSMVLTGLDQLWVADITYVPTGEG